MKRAVGFATVFASALVVVTVPGQSAAAAPAAAASAAGTATSSAGEDADEDITAVPGPPRAGVLAPSQHEQLPSPYYAAPEPKRVAHNLALLAVVGVWHHATHGTPASTSPGPVWGLAARLEPLYWLGVRLTALRGNVPISVKSGRITPDNIAVDQKHLEVIQLGLHVEPQLHFTPRLSGFAGAGITWGRFIAREPSTSGGLELRSLDRSAVYLNYELSGGLEFLLYKDWLLLDALVSGGVHGSQSGSAHDPVQAFSQEGKRYTLGGLPEFSWSSTALFSLGILL